MIPPNTGMASVITHLITSHHITSHFSPLSPHLTTISVHTQLPSILSPNDFLFPFLSSFSFSPCFTNHRHSATQLVQRTQKQKQNRHFRILSAAAHQDTTPTITIPTTTKTTSARKPVSVYLIERLGFSEEQSLTLTRRRDNNSTARDLQVTDLISFEKADNVITFLQEYCGLELSHIIKAVSKHPKLLAADVDKTLRPKVKLLQDLGFSTSDLAQVLSANPRLYLLYDLGPAVQALRGILGSDDENVVRFLKGLKRGTAPTITNNMIPNVNMLENEYGIPRDKLIKFLIRTPKHLMRNTESLRDVLVRVEDKWGITRDSTVFLRAITIFCSKSDDNINSKCVVFRSYGLSDSDILFLIKGYPECLGLSEATIKKKLEFFVNELGYEPAYLASRPVLLGCSLEDRVVPRHRVLSILKEKGRIKADYQLSSSMSFSDSMFYDKFIRPSKNVVPKLSEVFVNSRESVKTVAAE